MNKMQDVLKRLEAAAKDANTSLDEIKPGMRPGWAMRIAAAKQDQVDLANEYKTLLATAITKKVFVTGSAQDVASLKIGRAHV